MKTILLSHIVIVLICSPVAQEDDKTWFDFWVGKWEATWTESDGKIGRGTNTITRTLDNTVIQENFKVDEGNSKGYLGTSISSIIPRKKPGIKGMLTIKVPTSILLANVRVINGSLGQRWLSKERSRSFSVWYFTTSPKPQ